MWIKNIYLIKKNLTTKIVNNIKKISTFPFYFALSNFPYSYITFHPDSYVHFSKHQEFKKLFKNFIFKNKFNNSGDIARLWSFILNIKNVIDEQIPGEFAELGVWKGNTAYILAYYAKIYKRKIYLFDTFEGFNKKDLKGIDQNKSIAFNDTSLIFVKKFISEYIENCEFVQGYFPETIQSHHELNIFSIVSLDCDLYEPMKAGLEFFYPRMPVGGLFLLHDYSSMFWSGAKKAIDDFCLKSGEKIILLPDKSGSAFIRKCK